MAIKNIRKSVETNTSEQRLKNKLKENVSRFMSEAEGDEDLDMDAPEGDDMDLDMDAPEGGDDMDMDIDMDSDAGDESLEGLSAIENLEDTERTQVNDWISDILSDSLENDDIDDNDSLDTEMSADSLDPMGENQYIKDDVPMTVEDMENIIDSDDTLAALESKLAELAISQNGEEGDDLDMNMDTEEGDDMDLDMDSEEDEDLGLEESNDPMSGISKYFDKGYEGEDVKDELSEDVELAPASKKEGFTKTAHGLNDQINSTVKPTTGAGAPVDTTEIIKESHKKSAMLTKAAVYIDKQNKQIENLKLENYKLLKTNGLLAVSGEKINGEVRNKISEGFDRCKSVDQVNNFYNKITEKIKSISRPSLNESVMSKKTKISMMNEGVEKEETVSFEQQRKNMLMGLPTKDDVYFQN